METCSHCSKKFNVGFSLDSGALCAICAEFEELSPDAKAQLAEIKAKGTRTAGSSENAHALAARLLRAMLLALLAPIAANAAFAGCLGGLAFFGVVGNDTMKMVGIIGFMLIMLANMVFLFNWLFTLNNALEANGSARVVLTVLLSFFVTIYGIVVTLLVRRKLLRDPDREVRYGRLQVV